MKLNSPASLQAGLFQLHDISFLNCGKWFSTLSKPSTAINAFENSADATLSRSQKLLINCHICKTSQDAPFLSAIVDFCYDGTSTPQESPTVLFSQMYLLPVKALYQLMDLLDSYQCDSDEYFADFSLHLPTPVSSALLLVHLSGRFDTCSLSASYLLAEVFSGYGLNDKTSNSRNKVHLREGRQNRPKRRPQETTTP